MTQQSNEMTKCADTRHKIWGNEAQDRSIKQYNDKLCRCEAQNDSI